MNGSPAATQAALVQRSMSWAGQSAALTTKSAPRDDLADRFHAVEPARHRGQPAGGVELGERLGGGLHLGPAEVALAVEDLAVEVALLDHVAVDQDQLADAAAGERVGRPAAEPAHAEQGHARRADAAVVLRGRRAGRRRGRRSSAAGGHSARDREPACARRRPRPRAGRPRPGRRAPSARARDRTRSSSAAAVRVPSSAASSSRAARSGCSITRSESAPGRRM